jgi:predicted Zn-dependent protease
MVMKNVLLVLLVLSTALSQAQNSCAGFPKAEKAYTAGKLKAADKLIDKCLSDDKSNPSAYLLKSKIQYAKMRLNMPKKQLKLFLKVQVEMPLSMLTLIFSIS